MAGAKLPGQFHLYGARVMTGLAAGDDGDLLARVARSDADALGVIYDRYGAAVYSLAQGLLRDPQAAQEVTQDVFLAIWRDAGTYDVQRGSPRAWILALAHHKSVDALRRQRRHADVELADTMTGDDPDVVSETLRRLEGEHVRRALVSLPLDQRTALVLAYYCGYTQREIADRLGVPLGTVKTRMRDGLLRLRAMLRTVAEEPVR